MKQAAKLTGAALALTAATLFSFAPVAASADTHRSVGKCTGINGCRGQSACNTATTSCAGQNACKGEGWVKATRAECDAKGGKFEGA